MMTYARRLKVNNAAAHQPATLLTVKQSQLEYEFGVNVFGAIYMTQAVVGVGKMPPGGRIINIGTVASKLLVAPVVYSTTKAAMDALTTLSAGEVRLIFSFSSVYLTAFDLAFSPLR